MRVSVLHYIRTMVLFALILVLGIQMFEFDLFVSISNTSDTLHNWCLKYTPISNYSEIYAALVCGERLKSTTMIENFKNLGIYHVIVVSGSHLIFLSLLIEKFILVLKWNWARTITIPILVIYSLATGSEAPVTRALFSLIIRKFQDKYKLFWSDGEITFVSLLVCFLLFSSWTQSYSLLLSFVAAVSLNFTCRLSTISKHSMVYLVMLPFLLPLSAPHPLSVLANMTITPFIGVFMFPVSILSFILHPLTVVSDRLWQFLLLICDIVGTELPTLSPSKFSTHFLWGLAITLNFFGIYWEKYKK